MVTAHDHLTTVGCCACLREFFAEWFCIWWSSHHHSKSWCFIIFHELEESLSLCSVLFFATLDSLLAFVSTGFQIFTSDFWGADIRADSSHKSYRPIAVLAFRVFKWIGLYLQNHLPSLVLKLLERVKKPLDSAPVGFPSFPFHLANIVLHSSTVVLVFVLVHVLFRLLSLSHPRRPSLPSQLQCPCLLDSSFQIQMIAFLSSALFAVHPVHTEAVTGIVGFAELLCSSLYLCAFCLWASVWFYHSHLYSLVGTVGALFLFVGATLTKETGFTLLGLLLLCDLCCVYLSMCPMGQQTTSPDRSQQTQHSSSLSSSVALESSLPRSFLQQQQQQDGDDDIIQADPQQLLHPESHELDHPEGQQSHLLLSLSKPSSVRRRRSHRKLSPSNNNQTEQNACSDQQQDPIGTDNQSSSSSKSSLSSVRLRHHPQIVAPSSIPLLRASLASSASLNWRRSLSYFLSFRSKYVFILFFAVMALFESYCHLWLALWLYCLSVSLSWPSKPVVTFFALRFLCLVLMGCSYLLFAPLPCWKYIISGSSCLSSCRKSLGSCTFFPHSIVIFAISSFFLH